MRFSEAQIRAVLPRQSPAALIEVYTAGWRFLGKSNPEQALKLLDASRNEWEGLGRGGEKRPRVFRMFPRLIMHRLSEANKTTTGPKSRIAHHKRCLLWRQRPTKGTKNGD